MRRFAATLPAVLFAASIAAHAQTIYKCATPKGTVTYQETPCPVQGTEKRVDTSHGAAADPVAREMLEREAYRGDPLARGFVEESRAREAERTREREAIAREERLRRLREAEKRPVEDIPWDTPWGFPAKPGQARPQPNPTN